jgi:hypothetical protein
MQRDLFQRAHAQNQQSFLQRSWHFDILVQDGNEHVNAHRNPNLGLHRVGRYAEDVFDAQVLLDPAEETSMARQTAADNRGGGAQQQLDLSTVCVRRGDGRGRHLEVIGDKDRLLPSVGVGRTDAAQWPRKSLARFRQFCLSNLIAAHTAAENFQVGNNARETQVVFGMRDEKRSNLGDPRQPLEIHVSEVEQIKRTGFQNQCVQPQHDGGTCGAHFDVHGNRIAQIELCVQLDTLFGRTELGPREKLQGQIDGRQTDRRVIAYPQFSPLGRGGIAEAIQGVDRLFQIQPEVLAGIESPRAFDQSRSQILPQSPVAVFIGFGQRHPRHWFAQPEMVKRGRTFGVQAFLDVAPTLTPGQLRKSHADQLLLATEVPRTNVVALGQPVEGLAVNQSQDLGSNCLNMARVEGCGF